MAPRCSTRPPTSPPAAGACSCWRTRPPPARDGVLPAGATARALVVLAERVRDDAAGTLRYFAEQGVRLRVIPGDAPRTVGAVAVAVGLPGITDPAQAVDARTLPEDPDALADVLEGSVVFGRVTPQQKRAVVAALQRRGHVVAMTGDGVNDAMALKDADIGVAMGNGAAATRAVAQLVLLDSRFAHLPDVVAEGRRVIADIERAAVLFLVKNAYSLVLALVVLATSLAYPLAPIQLTLISAATIGVPGFVLALGPNPRRYVPGFLGRVLRLAVPAGVVVGLGAFTLLCAAAVLVVGAVSGALWSSAASAPWYPHVAHGVPSLLEGRWWTPRASRTSKPRESYVQTARVVRSGSVSSTFVPTGRYA
ncbi:HAD-IC family P-type ATPase [Saccharothrix yanglingensis]|uniref:HAD-IC family P-type ATPase n=1 Tax=Saccharothrix yanglingensis TaxID=659496 RepID=UPI0027D20A96|nr:HAD-IC family P-type ATPase [Saccharothrix yanglingensis]